MKGYFRVILPYFRVILPVYTPHPPINTSEAPVVFHGVQVPGSPGYAREASRVTLCIAVVVLVVESVASRGTPWLVNRHMPIYVQIDTQ
jgi:hypothetical protein